MNAFQQLQVIYKPHSMENFLRRPIWKALFIIFSNL